MKPECKYLSLGIISSIATSVHMETGDLVDAIVNNKRLLVASSDNSLTLQVRDLYDIWGQLKDIKDMDKSRADTFEALLRSVVPWR